MSQYQTAVHIIATHLNSLGIGASNAPGAANTLTDPKATRVDQGIAIDQLSLAVTSAVALTESKHLGSGLAIQRFVCGQLIKVTTSVYAINRV